jgi:probable phosphoglycerate mutase
MTRGPTLYLCRHGDTEWSPTRRLAGHTDLPLTKDGEVSARKLGERLKGIPFERVLVSPLRRAHQTAALAGFATAQEDARLREMNFGRYEGRTVDEVRRERPGWTYLRDGCPDGEGPTDVGHRADELLRNLEAIQGTVALFAHSVILRVLAARFLGLPPTSGSLFMMSPGALSILQYDPVEDSRAIKAWDLL